MLTNFLLNGMLLEIDGVFCRKKASLKRGDNVCTAVGRGIQLAEGMSMKSSNIYVS